MGTADGHSDAQSWASECPDIKNYKRRLNPVWHRMRYSCTHMATVGFKGLIALYKTTRLQKIRFDNLLAQVINSCC